MTSTPNSRVGYADGCFDVCHSGHMNALRQAAARCDRLVVGVHSDAEIARHKGTTVLNEGERYGLLRHLRWVDDTLEDAPYEPTLATLNEAGADVCLHGDDLPPSQVSGEHAYSSLERGGRFETFKRTTGVSTTRIAERLLARATGQPSPPSSQCDAPGPVDMRLLAQFCPPCSGERGGGRCVLVPSTFDLFHVGHAEVLEAASRLGLRVVAGVVDDADAVVPLAQRAIAVSSCKWVDDVVIGVSPVVSAMEVEDFEVAAVAAHAFDPQRELGAPPQCTSCIVELRAEHAYLTRDEIMRRMRESSAQYTKRNRACRARPGAPKW